MTEQSSTVEGWTARWYLGDGTIHVVSITDPSGSEILPYGRAIALGEAYEWMPRALWD
jgi:hypothetical protein